MGIFCTVNFLKPPDTVYHPGQIVSGVIKFALDEPMEVDKIVTSLKGIGNIALTVDRGTLSELTYKGKEQFVDIDTINQDEKINIEVGSYEIKFSFVLPHNIPSTTVVKGKFKSKKVKCYIKYYIRIKFQRPGLFSFNKHFRSEINVMSEVEAKLPREPVTYEESKKLVHVFWRNESVVNAAVTIINSALPIAGKIELHYEIKNNSHVVVQCVKAKLVQGFQFKTRGHKKIIHEENVPGTNYQTTSINCGDTQSTSLTINLPPDIYSLEHSIIISRYYLVRLKIKLPFPHRNAVINIPVQIGVLNVNLSEQVNEEVNYDDPPPAYWEVMGLFENENASDEEPLIS